MNVSLVYSEAERQLAQRLQSALEEIGTNVITADPEHPGNWGKSRLDLTEALYADSVDNCILLLSRESIPMVRRHHEHLSALVRVINTRPGFVLPLACELPLPAAIDREHDLQVLRFGPTGHAFQKAEEAVGLCRVAAVIE